jgi:hypothetical protein
LRKFDKSGGIFSHDQRCMLTRDILVSAKEIGGSMVGATLYGESSIRKAAKEYPLLICKGLLPIGSAPDGDLIAIFRTNENVVLIPHEHLWRKRPRVQIGNNFGSFARFLRMLETKASQL